LRHRLGRVRARSERPAARHLPAAVHALERHRFLTLVVEIVAPRVLRDGALLDIAPSSTTTPRLRELGGDRLRVGRLRPRARTSASSNLAASITDLPLPDDSVDLMICYHVLEHVPDDASAMAEIARVLRPGGVAIVQVPHRTGVPTDEDPVGRPRGAHPPVRPGRTTSATTATTSWPRLEKAGLDVTRSRPTWCRRARGAVPARGVRAGLVVSTRPARPAPVTAATIEANLASALPSSCAGWRRRRVLRVELAEQRPRGALAAHYRQLRTQLRCGCCCGPTGCGGSSSPGRAGGRAPPAPERCPAS
jgi:SAM-dependent methyltransferase